MAAIIVSVDPGSPAERYGIKPGERLVSINSNKINDVLDYRFYSTDERLEIIVESAEGSARRVNLLKGQYEDLGLNFESYLIDRQRGCSNKCIFCFIDQLPKGLRKTLYFKDDDARLSFLLGNYITLTNLSEQEIDRIVKMRISPVNISIHATNPLLRAKIMGNPKAAGGFEIMRRFAAGRISMKCQIVLMPGVNDGEELDRSLSDLASLYPWVSSISVVPVGLTRHRQGLYELRPFTVEEAKTAVEQVECFAKGFLKRHGTRLAYLADEFYLKAGLPIPSYENYEDFPQLENGVGMMTMFKEEFMEAFDKTDLAMPYGRRATVATGAAAAPFISSLVDTALKKCDNLQCEVIAVKNRFFGESIDVAGLVTGADIIEQLRSRDLGDELLIPASMLRHQQNYFLDDVTVDELSDTLQVPVRAVEVCGEDFLNALLGRI